MNTEKTIAVIGGGSWATALVKMLSNNVSELHWWMRNEEATQQIKDTKRNPRYLSSVIIDTKIVHVSSDLNEICKTADIIILAVPSAFLHTSLSNLNVDLSSKILF